MGYLKNQNKINEMLTNSVIPEPPMFKPEFPPQEQEIAIIYLEKDAKPEDRVESALRCLPPYDPAGTWNSFLTSSFWYWKIRDYAHAYRSRLTTPSMVAKHVISAVEECKNKEPPAPLLISFNAEEVREQAEVSTQRKSAVCLGWYLHGSEG